MWGVGKEPFLTASEDGLLTPRKEKTRIKVDNLYERYTSTCFGNGGARFEGQRDLHVLKPLTVPHDNVNAFHPWISRNVTLSRLRRVSIRNHLVGSTQYKRAMPGSKHLIDAMVLYPKSILQYAWRPFPSCWPETCCAPKRWARGGGLDEKACVREQRLLSIIRFCFFSPIHGTASTSFPSEHPEGYSIVVLSLL